MSAKEFTVNELLDAIEKNGLPQAFNTFFGDERGLSLNRFEPISQACALGQGAINLGVDVFFYVDDPDSTDVMDEIKTRIISLNDDARVSLPVIAETIRKEYPEYLGIKLKADTHSYRVMEHV